MKLLLDQNLSRRLLPTLEKDYPGSSQIQLLGMDDSTDDTIWKFAKSSGFVIVTKDADFVELSALRGIPPKVIWLNPGNVPNTVVSEKLSRHTAIITVFLNNAEDGVLEIE